MQSRLMTDEERVEVFRKVCALEDAGKKKEAEELRRTIPIAPFIAKVIKDKMGVETLRQCNFNLAEAEAEYGKDWLTT